VEDWTHDPDRTRYGCFLPDLTGLARDSSARQPSKDTISGFMPGRARRVVAACGELHHRAKHGSVPAMKSP